MNYNKFFLKLSLQVIMVFVIVIAASFIPDYLHDFFGDWKCQGAWIATQDGHLRRYGCDTGLSLHGPEWHWGYRHWLWAAMGCVLFVIQAIRIGYFINRNTTKLPGIVL